MRQSTAPPAGQDRKASPRGAHGRSAPRRILVPPPGPGGEYGNLRLPEVTRGLVAQVMLGHREWMLFAAPGTEPADDALLSMAACLARTLRRRSAPSAGLLACVPDLPPGAGAAVLHATAGQATIYARSAHLTATAATRLSALARHHRIPARGEVTITRAPHDELRRRGLLPAAAALVTAGTADIVVCEDLVTAEVAGAIGRLCTAHAALAARTAAAP